MTSWRITTVGPAMIAIIEFEGPTRLLSTATTAADERVLEAWLAASWPRDLAVAALLADRSEHGGAGRQERWVEALRGG